MRIWSQLASFLDRDGLAALVTVTDVAGSAPREAGARMLVRADGAISGTIGGGVLEWEALSAARARMSVGRGAITETRALGPELGQCCGGRVTLSIEVFDRTDRDWIGALAARERAGPFVSEAFPPGPGQPLVRRAIETPPPGTDAPLALPDGRRIERFGSDAAPVLLFGAGHVGRALVLALAPLPFAVTWIDSRDDAFPERVPAGVLIRRCEEPIEEVRLAPAGALALVMTHSHPLDLAIVAASLGRAEIPYVGLIGSTTKRARFMRRLGEIGLGPAAEARLVCPVGVQGIPGKEPAVIAAAIAAQLLQVRALAAPPLAPVGPTEICDVDD